MIDMAPVDLFAFSTPPLAVPGLVFARGAFTVKPCLDQPLLRAPDLGALLALCATADVLLERGSQLTTVSRADIQLLQDIEGLCKQLDAAKSTQETLSRLGMLEQFPHLAQVVTGQPAAGAQPNSCAAYLSYISLLNQVVMLGSQLFHDASVPQHHKYLAHQIALLYQSLNLLQGETKPIRRLVEARFDEIKSLSESQHPYLPVETADWLQEITKLCRQEIKQFPAYVHKRLEPMLSTARLKLRKPGATAAA